MILGSAESTKLISLSQTKFGMKSYIFFFVSATEHILYKSHTKRGAGLKFEPAETLFLAKHFPSKCRILVRWKMHISWHCES